MWKIGEVESCLLAFASFFTFYLSYRLIYFLKSREFDLALEKGSETPKNRLTWFFAFIFMLIGILSFLAGIWIIEHEKSVEIQKRIISDSLQENNPSKFLNTKKYYLLEDKFVVYNKFLEYHKLVVLGLHNPVISLLKPDEIKLKLNELISEPPYIKLLKESETTWNNLLIFIESYLPYYLLTNNQEKLSENKNKEVKIYKTEYLDPSAFYEQNISLQCPRDSNIPRDHTHPINHKPHKVKHKGSKKKSRSIKGSK